MIKEIKKYYYPPAILNELNKFITRQISMQDDNWKRIRIAVTQEEMDSISGYFLQEKGLSYARLMGIPLIVESKPRSPDLHITHKEDQYPFGKHTIMRTL